MANRKRYIVDPFGLERDRFCDFTGPGVYFLFLSENLEYVGKSRNINQRIRYHNWQDIKQFDAVAFIEVPELFMGDVECYYIHALAPPRNAMLPPKSSLMEGI